MGVVAFDGFIQALSLHARSEGALVCGACRRAQPAPDLHEQRHRYCEICRRPLPREDLTRDGHRWVCQPCRDRVEAEHPGTELTEYVKDVVARRYVDVTCPDDEALAAFEADVRRIGAELKRIAHPDQDE